MIKKAIYRIIYLWFYLINLPTLLLHRVNVGNGLRLRGRLFIQTAGSSKGVSIVLGNNVSINSSLASNPIGGSSKTIFNIRNNGCITICTGVGLSNTAIVSDTNVYIDEYTNIGSGTCIYDTDFHSLDPDIRLNGDTDVRTKAVRIGKRVFIGGHSIILKGVTIGDDAVIGAGSVVSKNVPSGEIWAGNPAKYIRKVKL